MNHLYSSVHAIVDALNQKQASLPEDDIEKSLALVQQLSIQDQRDKFSLPEVHQLGVLLWNAIQEASFLSKDAMKSDAQLSVCFIAIQMIQIGWNESKKQSSLMKSIQILRMITQVRESFQEDNPLFQEGSSIAQIGSECKENLINSLRDESNQLTVRIKTDASQSLFNYLMLNLSQLLEEKTHVTEFGFLLSGYQRYIPAEDWILLLGSIHDYCVQLIQQRNHEQVAQIVQPMNAMIQQMQSLHTARVSATGDTMSKSPSSATGSEEDALSKTCFKLQCLYVSALLECDQIQQAHQLAQQMSRKFAESLTRDKLFSYLSLKLKLCVTSSPQETLKIVSNESLRRNWMHISSSAWVDVLLFLEKKWKVFESEENKQIMLQLWHTLIHNVPEDNNWHIILTHFLRFCSFNSIEPNLQEVVTSITPQDYSTLESEEVEKLYLRFMLLARSLFEKRYYRDCIRWTQEALKFAAIERERGVPSARKHTFDALMQIARCQIGILDINSKHTIEDLRHTANEALQYVDDQNPNEELLLVNFTIACHDRDTNQISNIIKQWPNVRGYSAHVLVHAGMFALQFSNRGAAIQALETSLRASNIEEDLDSKSAVFRSLLSLYMIRKNGENPVMGTGAQSSPSSNRIAQQHTVQIFDSDESVSKFVNVVGRCTDFPLIKHMQDFDVLWLGKVLWNAAVGMHNQRYYVHCFDTLGSLCTICSWRSDVTELIALKLNCCRMRVKAALCIWEEKAVPNYEQYIPQTLKIIAQGREIDSQMTDISSRVTSEILERIKWAFGALFALELRVRLISGDSSRNIRNLIRAAATHEYVSESHLAIMCETLESAAHVEMSQVEEWIMTIFYSCIKRADVSNMDQLCNICISALSCTKKFTNINMDTMEQFLNILERNASNVSQEKVEFLCNQCYNNSAKSYRLNFIPECREWLHIVERLMKLMSDLGQNWKGFHEVVKLKRRISM